MLPISLHYVLQAQEMCMFLACPVEQIVYACVIYNDAYAQETEFKL